MCSVGGFYVRKPAGPPTTTATTVRQSLHFAVSTVRMRSTRRHWRGRLAWAARVHLAGASVAAQTSRPPAPDGVRGGLEHASAIAAGGPTGAAYLPRPGTANGEVRAALLNHHGVPCARAAAPRRGALLVGGVIGSTLRLAACVAHEPHVGGGHASPREWVPVAVADARLDGPLGGGPHFGRLLGDVGVADGACGKGLMAHRAGGGNRRGQRGSSLSAVMTWHDLTFLKTS